MRSEGPEIEIEKRNIIDYLRALRLSFIYLLHSFYLKNIKTFQKCKVIIDL